MADTLLHKIRDHVIRRRDASFVLSAAALVLTAAMLIAYALTGTSTFTPVLSGKVLALMGVCIFLDAVFTLFEVKLGKYAMYLMGLWMWLEYLLSQLSYISNVLVGIDGNQFSVGFLMTVAFGLLAWVAALASAILQKVEWGIPQDEEDAVVVLQMEEAIHE